MKSLQQINLKLILLQFVSLFFLINGIQRLYVSYHGLKYDALMNNNIEKFKTFTTVTPGLFLAYRNYFTLALVIIIPVLIAIINFKNNIQIGNSIILFVLSILCSFTGFFYSGVINNYLNYFCGVFGESYTSSFLIGGIILTAIGIGVLFKTTHKI